VSTGYIKNDFKLTDSVAQFLPSMAFIWFFLFSVPAGIFIDRFGKKKILNIGMLLTGLSMMIPIFYYSFCSMMFAFVFLGIGNTIVQVAANPLLHDVVSKKKFSSFMSLSQFIKAICSLGGPLIAVFMAIRFNNWKLVFVVYALISFLAVLWLYLTPISEMKIDKKPATFFSCVSLLKNKQILALVLGIFAIVGAEVGMKTNIVNLLQNVFNIPLDTASLSISLFFTAQMIGRFFGAISLRFLDTMLLFRMSTVLSAVGVILLLVFPNIWVARIAIFVIGIGAANVFPLIFSIAVQKFPSRVNEISGLMIMAIVGGAFIPPIMGIVSSTIGVLFSFIVLLTVFLYLVIVSFFTNSKQTIQNV
jgi:FHS family L-fucose permease-like MFS transporter